MSIKEFELCAENLLTVLGSMVNIIGGPILVKTRIWQ